MTENREAALNYAHEHRQAFLEDLKQFASIPSISADPAYDRDIQRAADWLVGKLSQIGIQNVRIFPTSGHPVVFGEYLKAGPDAPTMLIYGHYDVQPADPIEEWLSGPFDPTLRDESIVGRGVSDMKGQVEVCIAAVESILSSNQLPINIKFLIEGEEEIGSKNLGKFITENKELLACDFALNPDSGSISADLPTITYALRGLAYFELHVWGPDHDLHSGMFGGVVHNPAQALCELISGLHDDQGRVTVPGFYDRVRPLDEAERKALKRLPIDEAFYLSQTGAPQLWGEPDFTPLERVGARPTLEINGLLSGYTGPGSKTVLPAEAMAKISCRLVPDQDPEEIQGQIHAYLEQHAPHTIRWSLEALSKSPASISDLNSPAVQAMVKALQDVWGREPAFRREGGSVPVVEMFQKYLKIESVNTGFSLPDDRVHSSNERLHLPTWYRGIDTIIGFIFNVANKN